MVKKIIIYNLNLVNIILLVLKLSIIEFSTICPDIIGHTAIAKFYTTNIIPKAVPVIFLLTTIGIEGIIQLA